MIATTFRSEPVYLLGYSPNWETPPRVTFTKLGDISPGLTGTESRWALADTMRVRFEFSLRLGGNDSPDFRVALQRQSAANRRVLVPFWPGAVDYYTGGSVYTSESGEFYTAPGGEVYTSETGEGCWVPTGAWLTFERDWSLWEIHETHPPSVITPSTTAIRVPLMLGIFEEAPDPEADTSRLITVPIRFLETSEADMSLHAVELAFADGPAVAGRTPKIFPLKPDWATPVKAGSATVEIARDQIGFGRTPSETYYPQAARRALEMGFSVGSWEDVAKLIAFFFQRQGMVESFWFQGIFDELALTVAATSGSAVIAVDRALNLGDNRFIVLESGEVQTLRHVDSIVGNNLTLDTAPGAFPIESTVINSLILARFARPDFTVTFFTDRVAETTIRFIETPNEYFVPSGETPGTTSGALPRKAWGFRLYQIFPEVTKYWRFTSYERDITASGEVFLGNLGWEHTSVTDADDPEKCVAQITARAHVNNPLMQFLPFRLETDELYCDIVEFSPNAAGIAGTPVIIFTGTVEEPDFAGPIITVTLKHLLQSLTQLVPTKMIQRACNWVRGSRGAFLFGAPCGVLAANFTFTADFVSADGNELELDTIARLIGSVPTLSDGYFARGRIWFGSGDAYQSRAIYDSLADGGGLTLTLSHPFDPQPTGSVNFTPGCDGRKDTCFAKFNNYARFGGYPYLPLSGNPSLVAIKTETPAGGKK